MTNKVVGSVPDASLGINDSDSQDLPLPELIFNFFGGQSSCSTHCSR